MTIEIFWHILTLLKEERMSRKRFTAEQIIGFYVRLKLAFHRVTRSVQSVAAEVFPNKVSIVGARNTEA